MGALVNFVTPLHRRTARDYVGRMVDDKVDGMLKAKEYEFDYWDGDRRYGYGGYRYDGRWIPVARDMIAHFGLKAGDRVLDVGCAKGFLVKDLMIACPGLQAFGVDVRNLESLGEEAQDRFLAETVRAQDRIFEWFAFRQQRLRAQRPRFVEQSSVPHAGDHAFH